MNAFFSPSVFPKRHAAKVRGRPGGHLQHGLWPEDQPEEDEEAGEGVHHHEVQGEGGRNRTQGKFIFIFNTCLKSREFPESYLFILP